MVAGGLLAWFYGRTRFGQGFSRPARYRRLEGLRPFVGGVSLTLGAALAGDLLLDLPRWWLVAGPWDLPSWLQPDPVWLWASKAGLTLVTAASLAYWLLLGSALSWPELKAAGVGLDIGSNGLREGSDGLREDSDGPTTTPDRLTLIDVDLLAELVPHERSFHHQLVCAGIRPRATEANEAVVARLAQLIDHRYVRFVDGRLAPTLPGRELLELPRGLFLRDIPLVARRHLVQAEEALRSGNLDAARMHAGKAVERSARRWLRYLLSEERVQEVERRSSRPVDGLTLGPLTSELVGYLKEDADHKRRAGLSGLAKRLRDRLLKQLEVAIDLRNAATHSDDGGDDAPRSRQFVEGRSMLDATRAALSLGEEYLSALGAPRPPEATEPRDPSQEQPP